ncbi:MAG: hypothetical protein KJ749_11625 [Planctomycetes bacterium]|nr:hypothetical protein [Planctomycetota bacterium]
MLLLAEISDKVPTVAGTTVVAGIITLMAFEFGLIRRWLVSPPMPRLDFHDWALWGGLHEPGFAYPIIDKLGHIQAAGQLLGWNPPAALLGAFLPPNLRGYHSL